VTKDDLDEFDFLPEDDDDWEGDTPEENQKYEHYRFVADKGQNLLRIDKFCPFELKEYHGTGIQQAADANCILVNGVPVKSNYRVKPLDVISIVMDRPRHELEIVPEDIPLDIVYEDDT